MDIDKLLISTPDVCGGKTRINGTRVTIHQIVILYKQGYSPEEIFDIYPHLTLAQVYTALAHYHSMKNEIEDDLEFERLQANELKDQYMNENEHV